MPPAQLELLHTYPHDHLLARRSRIDLDNIDTATYPDAAALRPVRLTMAPGDVLFFPEMAGHYTRAASDQISLSTRMHEYIPKNMPPAEESVARLAAAGV